jgi:hypothetical protein
MEVRIFFWLDHGRDQHVLALPVADALPRCPVLALGDERADVGSLGVDQAKRNGIDNCLPGGAQRNRRRRIVGS